MGGFGNPKEGRRHYSLITFDQSDREAVSSFEFDCRWKYAAGGLPFDYPGFDHTVLVNMRARLAASENERRIFDVSLAAARERSRVLAPPRSSIGPT